MKNYGVRIILYVLGFIIVAMNLPYTEDGQTRATLFIISIFVYLSIVLFVILSLVLKYQFIKKDTLVLNLIIVSLCVTFIFYLFLNLTHSTFSISSIGNTDQTLFILFFSLLNSMEILNYIIKKYL